MDKNAKAGIANSSSVLKLLKRLGVLAVFEGEINRPLPKRLEDMRWKDFCKEVLDQDPSDVRVYGAVDVHPRKMVKSLRDPQLSQALLRIAMVDEAKRLHGELAETRAEVKAQTLAATRAGKQVQSKGRAWRDHLADTIEGRAEGHPTLDPVARQNLTALVSDLRSVATEEAVWNFALKYADCRRQRVLAESALADLRDLTKHGRSNGTVDKQSAG